MFHQSFPPRTKGRRNETRVNSNRFVSDDWRDSRSRSQLRVWRISSHGFHPPVSTLFCWTTRDRDLISEKHSIDPSNVISAKMSYIATKQRSVTRNCRKSWDTCGMFGQILSGMRENCRKGVGFYVDFTSILRRFYINFMSIDALLVARRELLSSFERIFANFQCQFHRFIVLLYRSLLYSSSLRLFRHNATRRSAFVRGKYGDIVGDELEYQRIRRNSSFRKLQCRNYESSISRLREIIGEKFFRRDASRSAQPRSKDRIATNNFRVRWQ